MEEKEEITKSEARLTVDLEIMQEAKKRCSGQAMGGGSGEKALIMATKRGDLEAMKLLINAGVDVNIADECGNTALHYACESGKIDLLNVLLVKNCSTTRRNNLYQTPMMMAISKDRVQIVKNLLERGVKPNHLAGESIETELNLACRLGNTEVVDLLLKSEDSQSPLRRLDISRSITCNLIGERPDSEIVNLLLSHGGRPNFRLKDSDYPIHLAINIHRIDICRILIENGAYAGSRNIHGLSPCMRAVQMENLQLLDLILSTGVDIRTRFIETDETAYDMAVRTENEEMISMIDSYLEKTHR